MDEAITQTLSSWKVLLTPEQTARLELFREELLEKKDRFNLISRNDAEVLWPRHILDALAGVPLLERLVAPGGAVADAGAGAGFPGIPLAVALEGLGFDLWDSSLKRQMFLTWTVTRLRLRNVRALCARIGQSGPAETGKYDAVVSRAMGKLENILPQCLNMLKPGGVFLAWQSADDRTSDRAGRKPDEVCAYRLPHEKKDRFILVFRKA